jgi:hypothetical protein
MVAVAESRRACSRAWASVDALSSSGPGSASPVSGGDGADEPVLMELSEVVGGGDEPPFRPAGGSARRRNRSMRRLNFVSAKTGSIIAGRRR